MQIHLLVEEQMLPVPANVKILANWGNLPVINNETGEGTGGEHMMIEGEPEAIKAWLKPFNKIWIGKGSPMCQNFEIMHTKDN